MVTGASTADLAIVLVDARKGVLEQSRRHAHIASLLGIPHLRRRASTRWTSSTTTRRSSSAIEDEFRALRARASTIHDITFIPISALHGDNVVDRSAEHALVRGPAAAPPPRARARRLGPQPARRALPGPVRDPPAVRRAPRLPRLRRPGRERRSSARATRCVVLPVRARTTTHRRDRHASSGEVAEAFPPMSVTIRLEDERRRLARRHDRPRRQPPASRRARSRRWSAGWPTSRCARASRYSLKHTTRTVARDRRPRRAPVDVDTLEPEPGATELRLNEIGRVHLRTSAPLLVDPYRANRAHRRVHPRRRVDERDGRGGDGQVARPRRRRAGGDLRLVDVDHGSAPCRSRPGRRWGAGRTFPDGALAVGRGPAGPALRAPR